jgi:Cof subfamily protein (haloacid dehalogenase superfamily)
MIRLAAIDLDGTLFNSQQNVTALNKQAIQNALERGIRIVIVTGRGRTGAERALDMLGMDLPYICSAGALAREARNGTALYAHAFHHPTEISHLFEFSRLNGAGLIADTPEGTSLWFGPDSLEEVMDPMSAADARRSLRSHQPATDFDRPLLKLTIAAELELLQQAEKLVREKCPSIHQTYSGLKYIDLTDRGVHKGTALKALAEIWKLHPREVAAIGDQAIDIEMLKYAGLPVAMANGVDELKQAAQWIAPSNDEDGVAWALERMVRENEIVRP